jgi:hypothetical protein
MVYLFIFLHWVMSLSNYENGVVMVKCLRTASIDGGQVVIF